ncbi:GAF and ANTAR domain-containing protein [Streptomyces kunmingensis]|uniref:GAF and ANTAR domain-containing protein n=1 Tax=Streptomyces kunmingensis TaxID=68225 RepID=A0ABU6C726_9ACTN|nr:GAF and ANTAR domain-containing protein [Streptomyces kunmingensis]MEB3960150.1 GAF and ANTAR domain-containing protein [Streptomyces kunmingensis]
MARDQWDSDSGDVPPPRDALTELLARARRAIRSGYGPGRALPSPTARLFGVDALTLNALTHERQLELLWADPPDGLGPELDTLQYTLGDGPTLQSAYEGRTVTEPDLAAADTARWPLFLPAAAGTPVRAVVALPLLLGGAGVGVLTGYRTTPGSPTTRQLDVLRDLAATLLLFLTADVAVQANGTTPGTGLRLYRAEVHQATGYLAAELDIPLGQALVRLRAHATAYDRALADLAHAFLTRSLAADALHR